MATQEVDNILAKEELVDFSIYYLDLVECPLDPNHKLRRHRLPNHLMKCKKSFPNKIKCPYGHYFYTEKDEMANHLQICSYKPKISRVEVKPIQKSKNINYNYDVDNYECQEPYWD
ncbi:TRM13/UPF0224 family, U11-48K-like CHHC zinc finger domain,Zinc finger C2H2-type [Cinara cedri]|uniref:TRM13/UPF0224 family, U11-48K-like CHHC zinc finger domain,Zinc finger C2H2-type n=1 Tax=Cinara cedri TaxID=506608 RepID=A0A5E4NLH9_9HEMI|nr:TRM13/UPF0224 family, U11-48K-like CHHC zinc finger domain,Zinc finger C2H2-type [Cinara cedri]